MLSFTMTGKTGAVIKSDLVMLYDNKQRILNQLPKVKTDQTKKKFLQWIDMINLLIKSNFDKAS